jgi:dTDP-4-dehydrorhamnose 3,5-epimerase
LVRVGCGEVYCAVVDLRPESDTCFDWFGVVLSSSNKMQLWVPKGFAHGFYVISEAADYLYKTTDYYAPHYERSIAWNDSDLGISWPNSAPPTLSLKDSAAPSLRQAGFL